MRPLRLTFASTRLPTICLLATFRSFARRVHRCSARASKKIALRKMQMSGAILASTEMALF